MTGYEDDKTKATWWSSNRRRSTTTDILNFDWYFCKSTSSYQNLLGTVMNAGQDEKNAINPNYIPKDTVMCPSGDRLGIQQPIFKGNF